jgi:hypothetical protein
MINPFQMQAHFRLFLAEEGTEKHTYVGLV